MVNFQRVAETQRVWFGPPVQRVVERGPTGIQRVWFGPPPLQQVVEGGPTGIKRVCYFGSGSSHEKWKELIVLIRPLQNYWLRERCMVLVSLEKAHCSYLSFTKQLAQGALQGAGVLGESMLF